MIKMAQFIHVIPIFEQNDFLVALIFELALQKDVFSSKIWIIWKIFMIFINFLYFRVKKVKILKYL